MIAAFADDRRHREAWMLNMPRRITVCGLEVWDEGPVDVPACHVCYPDEAHPMEAVWAACRRLDANYNAGLVR